MKDSMPDISRHKLIQSKHFHRNYSIIATYRTSVQINFVQVIHTSFRVLYQAEGKHDRLGRNQQRTRSLN